MSEPQQQSLVSLKLKNVFSWENETTFDFVGCRLLVGANSSGKSNVVRTITSLCGAMAFKGSSKESFDDWPTRFNPNKSAHAVLSLPMTDGMAHYYRYMLAVSITPPDRSTEMDDLFRLLECCNRFSCLTIVAFCDIWGHWQCSVYDMDTYFTDSDSDGEYICGNGTLESPYCDVGTTVENTELESISFGNHDSRLSKIPRFMSESMIHSEESASIWSRCLTGSALQDFLARHIVSIVPEHRGLRTSGENQHVITFATLEERLCEALLSTEDERHRWAVGIGDQMQKFFNVKRMSPKRGDDGKTYVYIADENDRIFPLHQISGGQADILMSIASLLDPFARFVVLDEPGRQLHATKFHEFRNLVRSQVQKGKTVLWVTHRQEAISAEHLKDVVHCSRGLEGCSSRVQLQECESVDEGPRAAHIFYCNSEIKPVYFAQGVILVEGHTEVRFMAAVDIYTENGLLWTVIPCRGKTNIPKIVALLEAISVPWVALMDHDALLRKYSTKIAEGVAETDWLYSDKQWEHSQVKVARGKLQGSVCCQFFKNHFGEGIVQLASNDRDLRKRQEGFMRQHCQSKGVFVWPPKQDLEAVARVADNQWEKIDWMTKPLEDVVDLVSRIVEGSETAMHQFLEFLHDKGALARTTAAIQTITPS